MEYYITRDGQQYGPYSEDQVRQYLADGSLTYEDLAWHEGAKEWASFSTFPIFSNSSSQLNKFKKKGFRITALRGILAFLLLLEVAWVIYKPLLLSFWGTSKNKAEEVFSQEKVFIVSPGK